MSLPFSPSRLVLFALILALIGCDRVKQNTARVDPTPNSTAPSSAVRIPKDANLAVVLDFPAIKPDSRFLPSFTALTQRLYRYQSDRYVVVTQLTNDPDHLLLWDGPVKSIKKQFSDAKAFADFLRENAAEPCHDNYAAMADTFGLYSTLLPRDEHFSLIVLSALHDSNPDQESRSRLVDVFATFSRHRWLDITLKGVAVWDDWKQIFNGRPYEGNHLADVSSPKHD